MGYRNPRTVRTYLLEKNTELSNSRYSNEDSLFIIKALRKEKPRSAKLKGPEKQQVERDV